MTAHMDLRVRTLGPKDPPDDTRFVLYAMTAARRTRWNHALQHAIAEAKRLDLPLIVLESLAIDHRWASDRIHSFVLQGMVDNRTACMYADVTYVPFVETKIGQGRGLMRQLSKHAALIVVDDFPTYLPSIVVRRLGEISVCPVHAVDSNGVLPMRTFDRPMRTAHAFRRALQSHVVNHITQPPDPNPLAAAEGLPKLDPSLLDEVFSATVLTPWEWLWRVSEGMEVGRHALAQLDIDHEVPPVEGIRGGSHAASNILRRFIDQRLERYAEDRNQPSLDASSGLSPWLHFGHISSAEVVHAVLQAEGWDPTSITGPNDGRRSGWWGCSESAEGFLDQIITWRELGFNVAVNDPLHHRYESIPDWARTSLEAHAGDKRDGYTFEELEEARTEDEIWNAAQRQLRTDGIIQNYLRMLWGKKILQWAPDPKTAADWMVALNDRWALDGRDPNSYTGIYWVLGRHDRAWGPERPIFGKVRYMTSENTRRKYRIGPYLDRYGD